MKLNLKKNIFGISALAFTIILLVFMTTSKCNNDRNQEILFNTELANAKAAAIDSMKEVANRMVIYATDSVQKISAVKIEKSVHEASIWKKKSDLYAKENKKLSQSVDSLMDIYADSLDINCLKVVGAMQKNIVGLQKENEAIRMQLDKITKALDESTLGWNACKEGNLAKDNIINDKVDLLKVKDKTIKDLSDQLRKQNTFINKNKGLIGIAIGVVGTLIIL